MRGGTPRLFILPSYRPERWASDARNCNPVGLVVLNPQEGGRRRPERNQAITILTLPVRIIRYHVSRTDLSPNRGHG
jgi:hypothetical protein